MSGTSFRLSGLAHRYASALFGLARQHRVEARVKADLEALQTMIEANADLRWVLKNPLLSYHQQASALEALLKKGKMNDLTRRFVGVVVNHRRLSALPAMMRRYFDLDSEARGEFVAEVTSAKALSADQKSALAQSLKKAVGGKVRIVARTDPGLLGGLVVKIGSRLFDASLSGKLETLKLVMKGMA